MSAQVLYCTVTVIKWNSKQDMLGDVET